MSTTQQYRIHGMCCGEEVVILRKEVGEKSGVLDLEFDVINARMTVNFEPEQLTSTAIIQAVDSTGMKAVPWEQRQAQSTGSFWERQGRMITTAISGIFLLLALLTQWQLQDASSLRLSFYLISAISGAWFVVLKAWLAARRLRPDMNLLMVSAILGAFAIGEYFEAATVAFLFALSLYLEQWNVARARHAISALLDLAPATARYRCGDSCCSGLSERPVAEVPLGAVVVVRPGERIPLDGEVVKGQSSVNQAPITGESMPVSKETGDRVFAGTINQEGTLEFRSDRAADETQLARIIHMVEAAQSKRANSQQWVDRFSVVYTPVMMALALAMAVFSPLLADLSWTDGIYRGLVVLVIACPCALVISTPVSIVAALSAAARNGVLIKGGLFLEAAGQLCVLALDKTGTLTTGQPEVQRLVPLDGHSEEELLTRAASLEAVNDHPLARAIVRRAREENISYTPADHFKVLPGKGGEGEIDGRLYWVGSLRLLQEKGLATAEVLATANAFEDAGHSVVAVGNDRHVCGLISIADRLREGVPQMVQDIRKAGVPQVVMLTGDNRGTAEAIAQEIGIDAYHAELFPEDKIEAIERLTQQHRYVAMVGDGINDAPAMAAATFGVAMGTMGTDAALETADMALMSDDLTKLPWLIRHSRRALRTIKQNIAFALGLKLLFFLLTLFGMATLWMAIVADMGTTLLVVFNSLRLLRLSNSDLSG